MSNIHAPTFKGLISLQNNIFLGPDKFGKKKSTTTLN